MRIIKKSETYLEHWKQELICARSECSSVLEVEEEDLTRDIGGDARDSWDKVTFECPVCGQINAILNLPAYIKDRISEAERRKER